MNNYTIFHSHTDLSNAFTTMDSVTKFKQYIDKAVGLGMSSFAFSEHGSMLEWVKKKEYMESNGLKYIHAVETYVTMDLINKERDNYHVVLIAKNYDGVQELLKAHSYDTSFNKEDGHFYYQPRISYDELKSFSDNIIITTACLGGILNSDLADIKQDFINFMSDNKDRCFLEIQHHNVDEQIKYNNSLYSISEEYGIPLIAGTDTHALNEFHMEGRALLQKRKGIHFDNESSWDLSMRSYDELVEAYEIQDSLPMHIVLEAIENTNTMSDMIEVFTLDRSHKYPKMHDNSERVFFNKIKDGLKKRGIKPNSVYINRIKKEFQIMQDNGSIDYILLEETIKREMAEIDVYPAPSRGSSSGSIINYLLGVTDIDSIRFDMIFERFMNPDRVSLCDIDSDWSPLDRPKVKKFIHNMPNLYTSEIVTFNTIAMKGAIRDVGGALDMPLDIVDYIAKNIEDNEEKFREEYKELFKYVDLLSGVIVSVGSHPAATIVSPIPLDESIGTFMLSTNDYPVSQINMKEVDSLNFVKLDILGLANIGVINMACSMAGIDRLTPDNIDFEDDAIWNHIISNKNNIFQFESPFAHDYLSTCLQPRVIEKMKKNNPNIVRLDIMSMANGAIRPAGDSYREALSNGEFNDNGHVALNKFLASTNGFLVYQEQVIAFLNMFCGFSMGEADIVRRGFSKKTGTEVYIPKIRSGFIDTMIKDYNATELEAEQLIDSFLVVIEDASQYLFSINHATPYSIIGYMTAYMRYYYPLEFLCASLIVNTGKKEKMADTIRYIKDFTDVKIKPIEFGKSGSEYTINKSENMIYKGIASIKYCNVQIAEELYELSSNEYESFTNLLKDIHDKTSVDARQLKILIILNFFRKFGSNKYLLDVSETYDNIASVKQLNIDKINKLGLDIRLVECYTSKRTEKLFKEIDNIGLINSIISKFDRGNKLNIKEQIEKELEYLGYVNFVNSNAHKSLYSVIEAKTYKDIRKPYLQLYRLCDGEILKTKITRAVAFEQNPFKQFDILQVRKTVDKRKKKKIDGKWVEIEDIETVLTEWVVY